MLDAKIIAMIGELSQRAIDQLMRDYGMVRGPIPERASRTSISLRYQAGLIEATDIIAAWEDDAEV